jgi:hypothetical protein
MSVNVPIAFVDDSTLSRIANAGTLDRSIFAQRYDPTCPSEFYRGYATILAGISEALEAISGLPALRQLIDEFDLAIKALPPSERQNGASFALMNVASYAQVGTVPQISATVDAELVCIAHCFFHNQARGL